MAMMRCNMRNDEPVLNALRDYYAKYRSLPSFSELGRLSGLAVSTLAGIVNRLKGLDFLKSGETGRLQPGNRFFERQLANTVRAGLPVPAAEVLPEGILIDEYLVDNPSRTLLLSVRGESMVEAGLLPEDIVGSTEALETQILEILAAGTKSLTALATSTHVAVSVAQLAVFRLIRAARVSAPIGQQFISPTWIVKAACHENT